MKKNILSPKAVTTIYDADIENYSCKPQACNIKTLNFDISNVKISDIKCYDSNILTSLEELKNPVSIVQEDYSYNGLTSFDATGNTSKIQNPFDSNCLRSF